MKKYIGFTEKDIKKAKAKRRRVEKGISIELEKMDKARSDLWSLRAESNDLAISIRLAEGKAKVLEKDEIHNYRLQSGFKTNKEMIKHFKEALKAAKNDGDKEVVKRFANSLKNMRSVEKKRAEDYAKICKTIEERDK